MNPALKASGIERLKLKYDEPPSNFAFNFNLRRSTKGGSYAGEFRRGVFNGMGLKVGRCRLPVSKPVLKAQRLWYQRLKLQYDETLSNFAFKFNLRRYIKFLRSGAVKSGRFQARPCAKRMAP